TDEERKLLLKTYRTGTDTRSARRAHVRLLRAEGWTWSRIRDALFCSFDFTASTLRSWEVDRAAALAGAPPAPAPLPAWLLQVIRWVSRHMPQDFGFFRSRWSCGCLSALLKESGETVSSESIRRGLHRLGFV